MPALGLIGYPLSHSFSPAYFETRFKKASLTDWTYNLYALKALDQLPDLILSETDLIGINVTIPHKQAVLALCDEMSEDVKIIGAANCISICRTGKTFRLKAYNTDFSAFIKCINESGRQFRSALVMGNGGSSKAIQYALNEMEIPFKISSRTTGLQYEEVQPEAFDLFINCTPVGMYNQEEINTGLLPLNYDMIHSNHYLFDLVYNPVMTPMMHAFNARGAKSVNGLQMLHHQANMAWDIFMENM